MEQHKKKISSTKKKEEKKKYFPQLFITINKQMETAMKEKNKKARRVEEASKKMCCLLIVTEVVYTAAAVCFPLLCFYVYRLNKIQMSESTREGPSPIQLYIPHHVHIHVLRLIWHSQSIDVCLFCPLYIHPIEYLFPSIHTFFVLS